MANRSRLGPGFCTEGAVCTEAEHWAIVPPLRSVHGPLPLTTEAVPILQRLLVGALLAAMSFDEPHKLFAGTGGGGDDVAPAGGGVKG